MQEQVGETGRAETPFPQQRTFSAEHPRANDRIRGARREHGISQVYNTQMPRRTHIEDASGPALLLPLEADATSGDDAVERRTTKRHRGQATSTVKAREMHAHQ